MYDEILFKLFVIRFFFSNEIKNEQEYLDIWDGCLMSTLKDCFPEYERCSVLDDSGNPNHIFSINGIINDLEARRTFFDSHNK